MSRNQDKLAMTALSIDDVTRRRLARLEVVARADGCDAADARSKVARWVGVSPGALERVRKGRVKGVRAWLAERVREAFCDILNKEIRALEHELFVAEAGGRLVAEDAATAAEHIAQARALMAEAQR